MEDSKFDEMLKALSAKAQEDGVMDPDEAAFIENIRLDAEKYEKYLNAASEDGEFSAEEVEQLTKIKEELLNKAKSTVESDGEITLEEKAMMEVLSRFLSSAADRAMDDF
ncbi:MAG: hypothetical protein INQ03_09690 [Candidatus Heimdallarchaeota archaeon]|nr:hypothetical protein [Candidatus Heimdallarchaeota archaeon]